MKAKKVSYDEDVRSALKRAFPQLQFGAGAILKGISDDAVKQGYCVVYNSDYTQKCYCTFKYVVYSKRVELREE